jgi:hypothetical protein
MIRSLQLIGFIEPAKRGITKPLIIQAKGPDGMPEDLGHSVFACGCLLFAATAMTTCSTSWLKSKATGDWMRRRRLRR